MCMYRIYMNIEFISDIIIYNKIGFIKSVNFREKGERLDE